MTDAAEPVVAPENQSVAAQMAPRTRLDKILAIVPRALSSHAHIIFLGALGIYLVVLPLLGVGVSSKSELIGGNYTNVTSDLGACIAAGLTVHLVKRERRRSERLEELVRGLHARHDVLEKRMADALAASERAEAAALNAAGGAR
jgi:hypothetical protein